MNKNVFKSIGAVLSGFVAIFILSYGTDAVLEGVGLMPRGALPIYGSELLIFTVLVYRTSIAWLDATWQPDWHRITPCATHSGWAY